MRAKGGRGEPDGDDYWFDNKNCNVSAILPRRLVALPSHIIDPRLQSHPRSPVSLVSILCASESKSASLNPFGGKDAVLLRC